jgi:orotate phosphoribosyltransferase
MSFNKCWQYEVPTKTSQMVWRSLGEGEVFVTREGGKPFILASGQPATLKADAERLFAKRKLRQRLLGIYSVHPCVVEADALSFAPNGMAGFAEALRKKLKKPIIRLFRPEGAPRTDIRYVDEEEDIRLTQEVGSVCVLEDVSTSGFSAHEAARVLFSANPDLEIHTLSMLQRDEVKADYQTGPGAIVYHTFVRQDLPLDVAGFKDRFPEIPVLVVP